MTHGLVIILPLLTVICYFGGHVLNLPISLFHHHPSIHDQCIHHHCCPVADDWPPDSPWFQSQISYIDQMKMNLFLSAGLGISSTYTLVHMYRSSSRQCLHICTRLHQKAQSMGLSALNRRAGPLFHNMSGWDPIAIYRCCDQPR